jgi:hypothetical protein
MDLKNIYTSYIKKYSNYHFKKMTFKILLIEFKSYILYKKYVENMSLEPSTFSRVLEYNR